MNKLPRKIIVLWLLVLATAALAVTVPGGYFRGQNLEPLGDAEPGLLQSDPALVLIFSTKSKNSSLVAAYEKWFNQNRNASIAAYGIVTADSDYPLEVVEEVLSQRGLQFPVFYSSSPVGGNNGDRVLLIRQGQSEEISPFSAEAVDQKLKESATAVAEASPSPSPLPTAPPAIAATPTLTPIPTPVALPMVPLTPTPVIVPPTPSGLAVTPMPQVATPAAIVAPTPLISPTPVLSDVNATSATATRAALQAGEYVNRRFGFSVRFPANRAFVEAQNGDGAVSRPTDDDSLDFRVWGSDNTTDRSDGTGTMNMTEYLKRHLSFIAEEYQTQVSVDRKLVIQDGDTEGRDYTYTYVKPSRQGGRGMPMRGRIQVFEVNGTFKMASVEGLISDFDRATDAIEQFMVGFQPTAQ
jgi:hypothetical protein